MNQPWHPERSEDLRFGYSFRSTVTSKLELGGSNMGDQRKGRGAVSNM